jgi:hypothetical protein
VRTRHPREDDEFGELDATMHRLDEEALAALTARLDVAARLREVRRVVAGLPEPGAPTDRG